MTRHRAAATMGSGLAILILLVLLSSNASAHDVTASTTFAAATSPVDDYLAAAREAGGLNEAGATQRSIAAYTQLLARIRSSSSGGGGGGCLALAFSGRSKASAAAGNGRQALADANAALACTANAVKRGREGNELDALNARANTRGELYLTRAAAHHALQPKQPQSAIADAGRAIALLEAEYKRAKAKTQDDSLVEALASALRFRAERHAEHHRRNLAAKDRRRVVAILPRSAQDWMDLGQADIADRRRSIAAFQKAAEIKPDDGVIQYIMGHMQLVRGNRIASEQCLKRALELNPKIELYHIYGQLMMLAGNYSEAAKQYERCWVPREQLGLNVGVTCNGEGGKAFHSIGRFRNALPRYELAEQLSGNRKGQAWAYREMALYHHHHLDTPLDEHHPEQDLGSRFLDVWGSETTSGQMLDAQGAYTPQPPLNPAIPDVDTEALFPAGGDGRPAGPARTLLEAAAPFVPMFKLESPGFLPNSRQLRSHSVAVIDLAQRTLAVMRAKAAGEPAPWVLDAGATGGCTGGYGPQLRPGMRTMAVQYPVVGFGGAAGCPRQRDERGWGVHRFGWRDAGDVVARWRALSGITEQVVWSDTCSAHRTDAELRSMGVSRTKMADGDVTSHKYTPYAKRCVSRIVSESLKSKTLSSAVKRKLRSARDKEAVATAVGIKPGGEYAVELTVQRVASRGLPLPGMRITLAPSVEEYGHRQHIKLPRDRDRMSLYNTEMAALWERYITRGSERLTLQGSARLAAKRACARDAAALVHLWYNLMPLNRGTGGTGITLLQGLALACGVSLPGKLPAGMQLDWEALLHGDPATFHDQVVTRFAYGSMRVREAPEADSTILDTPGLPIVAEFIRTPRQLIALLNRAVDSMPVL